MKTLTVRLPDALAAQIDAEAKGREISKSDVVRRRLQIGREPIRPRASQLDAIADLIGSVEGLPDDLSAQKKDHLKTSGYGRKRSR